MKPAGPSESINSSSNRPAFEIVLIAGGAAMLLALLYQIRDFLNPPLIMMAGLLLLWPLRYYRTVHAMYLTGGFLFLLWFIHTLSSILIPFALVYLLSFLFHPVLSFLCTSYRIPKWASALLVTTLVVGVVALFSFFLIPNVVRELELLGTRILGGLADFRLWMLNSPIFDQLGHFGVDKNELALQLTQTFQGYITGWMIGIPTTLNSLIGSIPPLLGVVTVMVLTPVVLFYMLKDFDQIHPTLMKVFPAINGSRRYQVEAGWILGNYLRGQLTISAIASILVTVALLLADIPFALLIGMMAGALNLIPSLGAILTNLIAVCLVVVFGERGVLDVVLVVIILLAEGLFEQAILVPKILSQRVGLHPVAILASLLVFGYFMGFVGLFIAVPFTALVYVLYSTSQKDFEWDLSGYIGTPHGQKTPGFKDESQKMDTANPDGAIDVTFPIN